MPYFQVDYRIQRDGFDQIEATTEEESIQKVTEALESEGEIVTIEAFAMAEPAKA